ncbi:cytochrome-c oxidase, cbb3-type subunit III [Exilibacterium tricleocarpae]|uniref:Cbb3-type cytochrome c oxidase subunit n=1 Tax=Exilibacterium tricleocarpae TaxID=2591008 RepID=A0A545U5T2_9GAMM|nr:cytochrome-c oxidase, cbb3-type subunit III [Exilibacterium tricleocarpae]
MILTVVNLILIFWVLMANRKVAVSDDEDPENKKTGHVYDGIEEYDNPLPKWWFQMFLGTLIFTIIYLALYPGLGSWQGLLGWTQINQLEREQEKAAENFNTVFGKYMSMPIEEVAREPAAVKIGVRLFGNNCAVCHGADAGGNFGFPDLTDDDWLYGGSPEQILHSLVQGRVGQMPAWDNIIGEENVIAVSEYVLSLSGQPHDETQLATGAQVYAQNCAACHAADGTGNQVVGAPNLTDDIWLYSGTAAGIRQSVRSGRFGNMPAQSDKLREEKIHLLAAYVYSLSLDDSE